MSNYNGKGLNSIGNREWTSNATRHQRQNNLQQQMEAAKKRKADRQAKQQATLNNNNNNSTDNNNDNRNARSSKFIQSYQEETRRWTTNTTTTRFLSNRKPSAQSSTSSNANNNANDNSSTNNNSNSSIANSRVFTQSFLQAHRDQQQISHQSNNASLINTNANNQQQLSLSSSTLGNKPTNPIVLDAPSHPINHLSYDQLQNAAASRHGSRIFNGATLNSGPKSIITDHAIGIHKPPSIVSTADPSQYDNLGDSISQINTASRLSHNTGNIANRHTPHSQQAHNTLNRDIHNHNSNDNSPMRRQFSTNNNNSNNSRDPRLRQNLQFGQPPPFERHVYRDQTPESTNTNGNNNSPTLTDRVHSAGERKYDNDKFNPTHPPPQNRSRISLNASTIQHLHPKAQQQIMNDTTFLQYQANALGEPVIWKNTQSDTGIYGVNFRAHRQSRISSKMFDPLSVTVDDNPENKDYNDNKDNNDKDASVSAIDLTASDTLDNQDLRNVNNRRARRSRNHKNTNNTNSNSNINNNNQNLRDESKDEQLSRINGQLQFQPHLSMSAIRNNRQTSQATGPQSLMSNKSDHNSNTNANKSNNNNQDTKSTHTMTSMRTIGTIRTLPSTYSLCVHDAEPGTSVRIQTDDQNIPHSPHKQQRDDDFIRIKDKYEPLYDQWRKIEKSRTEKKLLNKFYTLFKQYHHASNIQRIILEGKFEEYEEIANKYINKQNNNDHYKQYERFTVQNGPLVKMIQEQKDSQGDQLIEQLDDLSKQFRDATGDSQRQNLQQQLKTHIAKMIKWNKDHIEYKRQLRYKDIELQQKREKRRRDQIANENKQAATIFDPLVQELQLLMKEHDWTLYDKFTADLDNYYATNDTDSRALLFDSLKEQAKRVRKRTDCYKDYNLKMLSITPLYDMAKPFRSNATVNSTLDEIDKLMLQWRDQDNVNREALENQIDKNRAELFDLLQRLQAKELADRLNNPKIHRDDDDHQDPSTRPFNRYIAQMNTPSPPTGNQSKSNANFTNNNNNNNNNNNGNQQSSKLPNQRTFVFGKKHKSLSPAPDFDVSGYDDYRKKDLQKQLTFSNTIHNQPHHQQNRVYDPGTPGNPKALTTTTNATIHQNDEIITPGQAHTPTPSQSNEPTPDANTINTTISTQNLSVSTNITPQEPVVLQPVLAPIPTAGLTRWQRASQLQMHQLMQHQSDTNHHVGVLVEHLISRDDGKHNDNDNRNGNSMQQQEIKEFNKWFQKERVNMEMQFKVRKKLTAETDDKEGKAQVQVLEWFQDTMDFIDRNTKIQYDISVLIRIISEKGMTQDMLKKFNQVRRDFGEFGSWDEFTTWIFQVHKLTGHCIVTLKERFSSIRLKGTSKPDQLLRPFKEWEDLLIIALKANPDMHKYYHDTEQDLVGRVFGKLPKAYMDYIRPIQYANENFEPDDWEGLQTLIDMAAEEKQRQGARDFDENKAKSNKKTSNDALIGNKINVFQRGRGRRGRRGRGNYRNQRNNNRYSRFFSNKTRKRGNKYDNKKNQANRSGRGGNTSEYRQRGNTSNARPRGRGRGRGSGRGRGTRSLRGTPRGSSRGSTRSRGSRGRGRGRGSGRGNNTTTNFNKSKDPLEYAYKDGVCYTCNMMGHWQYLCEKLTKRQKRQLQARARREQQSVNVSQSTTEQQQHQQHKGKQSHKPTSPTKASPQQQQSSPTYRTDKKPQINALRQPVHLHINSTTDPEQVSRVLAGITNPRNNPTH